MLHMISWFLDVSNFTNAIQVITTEQHTNTVFLLLMILFGRSKYHSFLKLISRAARPWHGSKRFRNGPFLVFDRGR